MKINTSRLKAIWPWLVDAKYAWRALAVICVSLIISLRPHTTEPVIRITGLVLQLLGVGTVIWGISETRALFGHPSFLNKIKIWLGRFPLLRHEVVFGAVNITLPMLSAHGRGYSTCGPGNNPTIQARIDALEKNVLLIHERINQTQQEMDEEFRKINTAIKHEEDARKTDDKSILEKLEAKGTGGVHISAIGASWLFIGLILSTAAIEIAELLK